MANALADALPAFSFLACTRLRSSALDCEILCASVNDSGGLLLSGSGLRRGKRALAASASESVAARRVEATDESPGAVAGRETSAREGGLLGSEARLAAILRCVTKKREGEKEKELKRER